MITDRQKSILHSLIDEFIDSADPVGSLELKKKNKFDLSAATIRSEMKYLENDGYLYQPHTSAGRVPTDKAYRFFIDNFLEKDILTRAEQIFLKKMAANLLDEREIFSNLLSKILAQTSNNLSFSGILDYDDFHKSGIGYILSQPEFKDDNLVSDFSKIIDSIDDELREFCCDNEFKDIKIFIGEENPILKLKNYSVLISVYELPKKKKAVAAIMGPKRMDYSRNYSILKYLKEIINE